MKCQTILVLYYVQCKVDISVSTRIGLGCLFCYKIWCLNLTLVLQCGQQTCIVYRNFEECFVLYLAELKPDSPRPVMDIYNIQIKKYFFLNLPLLSSFGAMGTHPSNWWEGSGNCQCKCVQVYKYIYTKYNLMDMNLFSLSNLIVVPTERGLIHNVLISKL